MVNTSYSTAHFPEEWKEALVKPRRKKGARDPVYKNLRPISNLQFVSKVTERAVFDQLYTHAIDNDLFPLFQSAYREFHSTETALLRVVNDILFNMNRKHVSLLVLLDLSAAFDIVDHHTILLNRLEISFGVTGSALDWISSYLSGRIQRVSVNGGLSDTCPVSYGVPQGSCLGPLLFTIYASKLFEIIKMHLLEAHAYADDSQLYLSFRPDSFVSEMEALNGMEQCVRAARAWMIIDKMKMNDGKMEFMIIGTRQQLTKVTIYSLTVGNSSITAVDKARNLGVWFDSNMNFNVHITKTCNLFFYFLYNIRRIRKYLTYESTQKLVIALVIGHLDYCNSLFYGLPANQINKLQRVQNVAARLVSNTPCFCHISPVMYPLHWLQVKYRIIYEVILITFKAMQGTVPRYISDLITFKQQSYYALAQTTSVTLGTLKKEPTKPQEIEHLPRLHQFCGTHYLPVFVLRTVYVILNRL